MLALRSFAGNCRLAAGGVAGRGRCGRVTGAPDPTWNDDLMHTLNKIHGSDFEVVDTTGFVNG